MNKQINSHTNRHVNVKLVIRVITLNNLVAYRSKTGKPVIGMKSPMKLLIVSRFSKVHYSQPINARSAEYTVIYMTLSVTSSRRLQ